MCINRRICNVRYIYTHISTRVRKSAKCERVTYIYIYSVIICGAGAIMYNDTVKKIYTERDRERERQTRERERVKTDGREGVRV